MMMARLTPSEAADKQARNLKNSVEDIRRGVERVTTSPTELAAAKKEKMKAKINESIDNGKWERNLRKVSLSDWKTAMIDKGVNRIGVGIDAAKPKVEQFYSELFPFQDSLKAKVRAMKDLTLEDSIARMNTFTRGMATFKKK